jgi:hypothetical protein
MPDLTIHLPSLPQRAAALCRCMSFSDSCHSKTAYRFNYFQIFALDGDNHLLPVALGIVTTQTIDDFLWVYEQLKGSPDADFVAWLTHTEHAYFADRGNEAKAAARALQGWHL